MFRKQNTINESLRRAAQFLNGASDSPRRDAEILLGNILQRDRTFLYSHGDETLAADVIELFGHYLERRTQGEPVAYIIGKREFWSLPLNVNRSTLIPRPDTETLVETALRLWPAEQASILDLGTGTGAIALALASEKPQWKIQAVDIREDAVALANLNRQELGFDHVDIYTSDWFSAIAPQQFDLIVSNPPYIDSDDPHLQQGDVRFEPRSALVAEDNGLEDLLTIAAQAGTFLCDGGYLLLEHGYRQGEAVRTLLARFGYHNVHTVLDMGGCERVTAGQYLTP